MICVNGNADNFLVAFTDGDGSACIPLGDPLAATESEESLGTVALGSGESKTFETSVRRWGRRRVPDRVHGGRVRVGQLRGPVACQHRARQGTATGQAITSANEDSVGQLVIADLDGDGDLDVAATTGTSFSQPPNPTFINDGTGTFSYGSEALGATTGRSIAARCRPRGAVHEA